MTTYRVRVDVEVEAASETEAFQTVRRCLAWSVCFGADRVHGCALVATTKFFQEGEFRNPKAGSRIPESESRNPESGSELP